MRNLELERNLSLALCFGSGVAVALAAFPPDAAMSMSWRGPLLAFGLLFFFCSGMYAFFVHQALRAKAALARGEDVLAQWMVDAAATRAFIAAGHDFEAGPPPRHNEFRMEEQKLEHGLKVIVGKEAIQIGEHLFVLSRRDIPEVTFAGVYSHATGGLYAYLRLYYPASGYGGSHTRPPRHAMLRFPVADAAYAQAEAAMAYYREGRPGEPDFFHGPGDGTDAEDLSECITCGYKTHTLKSHCPQCGAGLQSRRWSRRLGFVLILCGIGICAGTSVILHDVTPTLLNPGQTLSGLTPAKGLMILALLVLLLVFGITAIVYGIWQRLTGRRSAWVIAIVTALWTAFIMSTHFL